MATQSREDKIREMAYSIWEAEGQPDGHDLDHYLQAEQMLTAGEPETTPAKAKTTRKTTAKKATTRKIA